MELALTEPLALVDMLAPVKKEGSTWSPLAPTLAGMECSEADCGKMMQRFLISESLIPLIMKGDVKLVVVQQM